MLKFAREPAVAGEDAGRVTVTAAVDNVTALSKSGAFISEHRVKISSGDGHVRVRLRGWSGDEVAACNPRQPCHAVERNMAAFLLAFLIMFSMRSLAR
jgi:hypothetical protein